MKTMSVFAAAAFALALSPTLRAEIQTMVVEYKDGDVTLEGWAAWDDAKQGERPAVLVVHDWMGLQEYPKERAKMLAELGYFAFCADIYGKGVRPSNSQEAAQQAGSFKSNLPLLRKRVNLAFEEMLKQSGVDKTKTGAIGYCFGGTTVLELARSSANVGAVVSFHGNLATSLPAAENGVKARVLVCHGADDPFVKPDEVAGFKAEMEKAKVNYEFISYPGAVHSFTKKAAGNDKSKGNAYDADADKKSWQSMQDFFNKTFGKN